MLPTLKNATLCSHDGTCVAGTRLYLRCLTALCRVLLCAAALPAAAADGSRTETVRHAGVTLTLAFTPGTVSLDRDILLTLRITHPEGVTVSFPALHDRLQGFRLESGYDRDSTAGAGGLVAREHIVRLTPLVAQEYRLAPMAVTLHTAGGTEQYFATPPMTLPLKAVTDEPVGDSLRGGLTPVPIRPSPRTLMRRAGLLLALALAVLAGIYLIRRIRHRIRIMRLSPRERAFRELALLLARNLPDRGLFKDFYLELTMIVRRYIERQHHVRAPEQTTEEFLQAVADDTRFHPVVVERLQRFLEAADLVKFATWQPDDTAIDNAVATARDYLASDTETPSPENRPSPEVLDTAPLTVNHRHV